MIQILSLIIKALATIVWVVIGFLCLVIACLIGKLKEMGEHLDGIIITIWKDTFK